MKAAMCDAVEALDIGDTVIAVEARTIAALEAAGFGRIDYVEVRDGTNLERRGPGPVARGARVFVAAWMGRTRLIDNWGV